MPEVLDLHDQPASNVTHGRAASSAVDAQAIVRRLPELICVVDANAAIHWANREGLAGRSFLDLIGADDRAVLLESLRRAVGAAARVEVSWRREGQPAAGLALVCERLPDADRFLLREMHAPAPPSPEQRLTATLQEIAADLNSTLRLDEVLRLIITQLQRVLPYTSAGLLMFDADRLVPVIVRGLSELDPSVADRDFSALPTVRQVVQTRQAVRIGDTRLDERWQPLPGLEHIRCWLGLPLQVRDRLIGVLTLDHTEPQAYTDDDLQLAQAFAAQASAAIDNARLYEETQRRADHLAALNEVAATVSQSLDLEQTLRLALDKALDVVGVEAGAISLIDEAAGELVIRAHRGWRHSDIAQGLRVKLGAGLSGRAVTTGEVVITGDVRGDPRLAVPRFADEGVQAMALAPMRARGRVVGIFSVMHYAPRQFSTESIEFLKALADQIGVALDNARLYEMEYDRRRTSDALRELSGALGATLDIEQAFGITLQHLPQVVPYDRASIMLIDNGQARVHAAHGYSAAVLQSVVPVLPDSLLGRLAGEKRPLIVSDPPVAAGREADMRSWLGAPLLSRGEVVGALVVESRRPHAYTEDHAATLLTLANHLAGAVENARVFMAEQRRSMQMALINEIARQTSSTLDLDDLLARAASLIHQRLGYRAVGLFFIDATRTLLALRSAAGAWSDRVEQGRHQPVDQGLVGRALRSGGVVISAGQPGDPDYATVMDGSAVVGSEMVIPLRHGETVFGALAVQHARPQFFQSGAVAVLQTLADQLSIAIDNARLYQETTRRVYELNALHEMAVAGTSTSDFTEVSQRTIEALQKTLGPDYSLALLLVDGSGTALDLHATSRPEERATRQARIPLGRGIVGVAAQTGEPVNAGDVLSDSRYLPAVPGTRSEMAIPLKVGDRVIGVIDAQSTRPNAFSQDDGRLLLTAAGQLAVILDKARLYSETRQRLVEMSTLQTFARSISTTIELSEVLDAIAATLKEVLRCRGVSIALIVPDTQTLEIRAAAGIEARWIREAKLRLGEGISGQVAAMARPVYVADVESIPDFIFFDRSVRSLLAVPLTVKDRVIGTLTIDQSAPNAFTEDDERVLTIAAAQAAVAIENAQLYEELKERARRLEHAYRDLQEADRLKDELVQNVSHELRTPLTFVKGYVELLLEGDMGPINERQRESLTIVAEKTNSVTRLVSDIIFLEQIERESLQLSDVQMVDLARLALQGGEVTAAASGVRLALEAEPDLPVIQADRDRINQVFDNLLANAIKFSPEGGTISVRLRRQGDAVLTSVADTGIGIPPEHVHRVFERFYQVDGSATRRFAGAGVGLAIVKRIVDAHSGRVWVDSEVGKGSTFSFALPVRQLPGAGKARRP